MKQLKTLVFVMAFVMMMILCAGALAEGDDVTFTVNVIDSYTKEPVKRTLMLTHSQCLFTNHEPETCGCFNDYAQTMILNGLTPCECGTSWWPRAEEYKDVSTATFTLKRGHKYVLAPYFNPFGHGEDYLYQIPGAYFYADEETGEISWYKNGLNLTQTGKNEFLITMESHFEPATVSINATKLMDGKTPDEQKFAFHLWKLTDEQMKQVFAPEGLILEEDFADVDIDSLPEDFTIEDLITPEILDKAINRLRDRLKPYPSEIVYNDGGKIAIHNKEYNAYNMPESMQKTFNYVIAEVIEPGKPICYDKAVYGISASLWAYYNTLPSSLEDDWEPSPGMMYGEDKEPIRYDVNFICGINREEGLIVLEGEEAQKVDTKDIFIFRNRTCPFYNPGESVTPAAPAVPRTGDNNSIMLWLALVCVSGMALLGMNRKKA